MRVGGQPDPDDVALLNQIVTEGGALIIAVDGGDDDTAWSLHVEVYDAFGLAVPGSLEFSGAFDSISWRPDAPWTVGERYRVALRTIIDPGNDSYPLCTGVESESIIDIVDAPADVAPPPLEIEESWSLEVRDDLESYACCDGAMPYEYEMSSPSYGCDPSTREIVWDEGTCVAAQGTGKLAVDYRLDVDAVGGDLARWAIRVVTQSSAIGGGDLDARWVFTAPECVRVEIFDRAVGVVHDQEVCHGDHPARPLGVQARDVAAELDERCEGAAYVCESSPAWDPTRCKAWPVDEDAPYIEEPRAPEVPGGVPPIADGGCRLGGSTRGALLIVVAVGLAGRRRRRWAGARRD